MRPSPINSLLANSAPAPTAVAVLREPGVAGERGEGEVADAQESEAGVEADGRRREFGGQAEVGHGRSSEL